MTMNKSKEMATFLGTEWAHLVQLVLLAQKNCIPRAGAILFGVPSTEAKNDEQNDEACGSPELTSAVEPTSKADGSGYGFGPGGITDQEPVVENHENVVQTTDAAQMVQTEVGQTVQIEVGQTVQTEVGQMVQTEVGQVAQADVRAKTGIQNENTDKIEFGIWMASEIPTVVEATAMAQTKELESMVEIVEGAKGNVTPKQPVNVADTAMTDAKGDGTAEAKVGEVKNDAECESRDRNRRRRQHPSNKPDENATEGSETPELTAEADAAPTAEEG